MLGTQYVAMQRTVISSTASTETVRYTPFNAADAPDPSTVLVRVAEFRLPGAVLHHDGGVRCPLRQLTAAGVEVLRRIGVLEAFNGQRFATFTVTEQIGGGGMQSGGGSGGGGGGIAQLTGIQIAWRVDIADEQIAFVNASYDALKESVYVPLAMQTRLSTYLDVVEMVVDGDQVRYDTTAMSALLEAKWVSEPRDALIDLVELNQYTQSMLTAFGFDGVQRLRDWVDGLPMGDPLRADAAAHGVVVGSGVLGGTELRRSSLPARVRTPSTAAAATTCSTARAGRLHGRSVGRRFAARWFR